MSLTFRASGVPASANADGYSHGNMACLQGTDGEGIRLTLNQHRRCDGQGPRYPYLKVYVREVPVQVNKPFIIGETNWAFICPNPKESCKQFRSGQVMFNHFEEINEKDLQTDGWYELRFDRGLPESGRFKVDCYEPCG